MFSVAASSRGAHLEKYLPKGTTVSVTSGGKLDTLKEKAKKLLPPSHGHTKRHHIYFLGGIPDITELLEDKDQNYREAVFSEEPSVTSERVISKMKECQRFFLELGALPIFCTIPKTWQAKYNLSCLLNGKTSTLRLVDKYQSMQENLDSAMDIINNQIYELNNKVKVSTPFLHQTIREKRGKKGQKVHLLQMGKDV